VVDVSPALQHPRPHRRPLQRHFSFLSPGERQRLFYRQPLSFGPASKREVLAHALGATLYTPATHRELAGKLLESARRGLTSTVLCLEDAIGDHEVEAAEWNLVAQLAAVAESEIPLPLLFVRVRNPEQIRAIGGRLGPALDVLTGFVLPKFEAAHGPAWLKAVEEVAEWVDHPLYVMPVLEGPRVLDIETRVDELGQLAAFVDEHRDQVLAVRLGATDLSGLLGLRRSPYETIYDIAPIRDCLSDIVNVLLRPGRRVVVTGPVWEYFTQQDRLFRPLLRQSLFDERGPEGRDLRSQLLHQHLDGLIAEVRRDRANGLVGKTVVHPTHVELVNAMHTVTLEEFLDADSILAADGRGASASVYHNKMNEAKPHRTWALGVRQRAEVFGVLREGVSMVELLDA
jgi:citrate lyase beta subunit